MKRLTMPIFAAFLTTLATPGMAHDSGYYGDQPTAVLYFEPNSASLTPASLAEISRICELYRDKGNASVSINSHAAPTEADPVELSLRRGEAVRRELAKHFADGVMTTQAFGAVRSPEDLPIRDRRVEITLW